MTRLFLNTDGINVGSKYRSALFYENEEHKVIAEKVRDELNETMYDGKIVTQFAEVSEWWPAEEFHQKFAERTGRGMCHIPYKPLAGEAEADKYPQSENGKNRVKSQSLDAMSRFLQLFKTRH